jgi:hypothetical protein
VHLAGVGIGELAELQIDDDQAAELAVEEEQVDSIPLVADAQPFLPADKRKVAAQFQQYSVIPGCVTLNIVFVKWSATVTIFLAS